MNWKIIEDACKCEIETFLTWEDAAKYLYRKKLDKKLFSIVPYNSLQTHSRLHKFLVLEDLSKCGDFKDAIYIKDVKKFRKVIFKIRFLKIEEYEIYPIKGEIKITSAKDSHTHKTHLTDTLNNKIYL